ncbi:MAG: Glycosyltransferase [Candidatus Azambacteria bacterium GW2011_GWF2_46_32]|uniref:Glycosyltransferase n=1 Tax=Candidatus Azambacteria bacterium GW2011_GWF2_46_32 TaxID=1618628 RepID=A0A0G1STU8_9BACT|nr:MAG: Glycosyltransferase [Candidatus Azambacteria bacterium GW2011_GWF2_46_32]
MKIIIATGIFPPDIGGPATYSETIAEELTRRGFNIRVVTYADRSKNQEAGIKKQGYGIVRISRTYPKGLRHFVYFWKLLRISRGADVVYAQDLISAGLPAMCAAKLLRKKCVGTTCPAKHNFAEISNFQFSISKHRRIPKRKIWFED